MLIRLLFADVWKANDTDSGALRRARFVREVEQFRGHARCQVCALKQACRAEWKRWSCVVQVFEPCLSVLAQHQVYVRMIWSNVDDHPDEEKEGWGIRTNYIEHKNETLALHFAPAYVFLYQSTMGLRHPAGSHASSTKRMTLASSVSLCSMRM